MRTNKVGARHHLRQPRAVKFAAGFANRLVIDPNAVFSGTMTGGNAICAAHVSTTGSRRR